MRKWLKRLSVALAILLALALLAVGLGWRWLQSDAGGAFVKAKVLDAARDALAGKVSLDALSLKDGRLVLDHLKLFTPEGELVLEVDRVEAQVDLWALTRNDVRVRALTVTTPALHLVEDERGLNLSRALAARRPSPAAPGAAPGKASPLTLTLERFQLKGGSVDFQGEGQPMALVGLELAGDAAVHTLPLRVEARLAGNASARAPLVAPLTLSVTATSPSADAVSAQLALALGETTVKATAAWPALEVSGLEVHVSPEVAQAFAPGWPVKLPVEVSGAASTKKGALVAQAGSATVSVDGAWDLAAKTVDALRVEVKDVDLSQLLEGGRPSRLSGTLKGSFSDLEVATLTGALWAHGAWLTREGQRLAVVDAELSAEKGALSVKGLVAKVPGVSLTAAGHATLSTLGLKGRLVAEDLAKTAAALETFTGTTVPRLAGHGALDVTITGPLSHPGIEGAGRFETLAGPSFSVERLDLDGRLPDVRRPFNADAHLQAKRLVVGDTVLDEVTAKVETQGRALDAQLSMKGLGNLELALTGLLDADVLGLELSALSLRSPEGEWALEGKSRVAWPPGRLTVSPTVLRNGPQRLSGEAKRSGQKLLAHLGLEGVRLSALPRVVAPPSLGLGGTVSATVDVDGKLPTPAVTAKGTWREGSVRGVAGLDVDFDGSYRTGTATGRLAVSTAFGKAEGDFELPVDALVAGKDADLRLHLAGAGIDARQVAALARVEAPVDGLFSVGLDVTGRTSSPRVKATVDAPELSVAAGLPEGKTLALAKAHLGVSTSGEGTLDADASAEALGGSLSVELMTPLTIAGLRAKPPSRQELEALPVTARVRGQGLRVAALRELGLLDDDELSGLLSVDAALSGSYREPKADLSLALDDATVPPLSRVAGRLRLKADEAVELSVESTHEGRPLVKVDARLGAALSALRTPDALGDRPLVVRGTLFPFELEALQPEHEAEAGTSGVATASLELDGTPNHPTLKVGGSVQKLAFSRLGLGSARLVVKTEGNAQAVSLAIGGEGRDDLKVKGTVGLDLSLPALRKGLEVADAPLDFSVQSRQLDLAFLSGLSRTLRVVGGRLDVDGTVKGTVGSPDPRGHLGWTQGRLSVLGYGEYKDLELVADASNDVIDVQKLDLRAGAGSAHLVAKAVRQGRDLFHLTFSGGSERFPAINDDQLVAIVTLKLEGQGDVTKDLVDITELVMPRVDVELPDVKRKDLQDLERPSDVVVLRGGLSAAKRRQRAAAEASREEQAREKATSRLYRAVVVAPRNIWVRSSDLNLELGLSDGFRWEYQDSSQLFGEATIMRGRLEVIGREFEVQKGSQVRFAGKAKEPYVNVNAIYLNERDKEKTKVTVTVAGKGKDVSFKVSSDPPMPESEIYTLLATGRRQLQRSSGASITTEQAVSALGAVAAAQVKAILAKKLPIDVLNFEAAENFQSANDIKFDVGKYLSDSLFLGFSYQPGARPEKGESQYAGRLEYQISRQWTAEAWGGTAPAAGADLLWSRDY